MFDVGGEKVEKELKHHTVVLIKVQLDATVCRHLFTATSLYMFRVSRTHHQEY